MSVQAARTVTTVFFQDECYKHRFVRSGDISLIVERPERLRAIKLGLAAGIACVEENNKSRNSSYDTKTASDSTTSTDLVAALQDLDLSGGIQSDIVRVVKSTSSISLLHNEAIKFVHGDIDGDVYLENLTKWAKESTEKIKAGESEIPSHLAQGDLYLCPESLDAIQGALGVVCEAIDHVVRPNTGPSESHGKEAAVKRNAFVAIRPPGHHCGEDTPSGFCFVNNVVVGAAHAYLKHEIDKIVIFDIDLHHGNGTQSLVWQINEERFRKVTESEAGSQTVGDIGPEIFYGSIHDILSYPCEDGKPEFVQAASVSIHGNHGQHIENIHLETYDTEEYFWARLYDKKYSKVFEKAEAFMGGSPEEKALVFISCGFDASEHEYPSMSRHNRRVPTSFFHRFAADSRKFADKFTGGKLISILEGGYSDRALISGGMAHIIGLVDTDAHENPGRWNVSNLISLEKSLKKRRGGKTSLPGPGGIWLERALEIYHSIELSSSTPRAQAPVPPSSMTLRARKTPAMEDSSRTSPSKNSTKASAEDADIHNTPSVDDVVKGIEDLQLQKTKPHIESEIDSQINKKGPRVLLRVKDPQSS